MLGRRREEEDLGRRGAFFGEPRLHTSSPAARPRKALAQTSFPSSSSASPRPSPDPSSALRRAQLDWVPSKRALRKACPPAPAPPSGPARRQRARAERGGGERAQSGGGVRVGLGGGGD